MPKKERPFAWAVQSNIRPDDYTVEWDEGLDSVGMLSRSEAHMWAGHMNLAYSAGRKAKRKKNNASL